MTPFLLLTKRKERIYNIAMDLKKDIERYLAWKKIPLYKLCLKAGISTASAYRFMSGERDITYKTVEKLSKAMQD